MKNALLISLIYTPTFTLPFYRKKHSTLEKEAKRMTRPRLELGTYCFIDEASFCIHEEGRDEFTFSVQLENVRLT
jgi:hypothetical protein